MKDQTKGKPDQTSPKGNQSLPCEDKKGQAPENKKQNGPQSRKAPEEKF